MRKTTTWLVTWAAASSIFPRLAASQSDSTGVKRDTIPCKMLYVYARYPQLMLPEIMSKLAELTNSSRRSFFDSVTDIGLQPFTADQDSALEKVLRADRPEREWQIAARNAELPDSSGTDACYLSIDNAVSGQLSQLQLNLFGIKWGTKAAGGSETPTLDLTRHKAVTVLIDPRRADARVQIGVSLARLFLGTNKAPRAVLAVTDKTGFRMRTNSFTKDTAVTNTAIVGVGDTVVFDALESTDEDTPRDYLRYQWTQKVIGVDSAVSGNRLLALDAADTVAIQVLALRDTGTYRVELRVSDGIDTSAARLALVSVVAVPQLKVRSHGAYSTLRKGILSSGGPSTTVYYDVTTPDGRRRVDSPQWWKGLDLCLRITEHGLPLDQDTTGGGGHDVNGAICRSLPSPDSGTLHFTGYRVRAEGIPMLRLDVTTEGNRGLGIRSRGLDAWMRGRTVDGKAAHTAVEQWTRGPLALHAGYVFYTVNRRGDSAATRNNTVNLATTFGMSVGAVGWLLPWLGVEAFFSPNAEQRGSNYGLGTLWGVGTAVGGSRGPFEGQVHGRVFWATLNNGSAPAEKLVRYVSIGWALRYTPIRAIPWLSLGAEADELLPGLSRNEGWSVLFGAGLDVWQAVRFLAHP